MVAEWFDPHITWSDLLHDENLNILTENQSQKIRIPIMLFRNTDNNLQTLVDSKANILVKKMGTFIKSSKYEVRDTAYYKGSANPIEYTREFHYKFNCQFSL